MTIDFTGRVVAVTGAGNGLGREYSLELARLGAKVVVNDLGGSGSGRGASRAAADEVVDAIRAAGGTAVANHQSVGTREGGASVVQTAIDTYGRLDALISNAGFLRNNRFEDMTDEEIDAVLNVHLKGAFYVGQPAYRAMLANGYGRILFTSSASAMFGHPWQANYAAAKGGLMGLSHVVALEGARHGILSNLILPQAQTRLGQEMDPGYMEVIEVAATIGRIPFDEILHRIIPAFNVPLAVFLVSEACTDSHGIYTQIGGRYARVSIAASEGWHAPGEDAPTAEALALHWPQVRNRDALAYPENVYEEIELVVQGRRRLAAT